MSKKGILRIQGHGRVSFYCPACNRNHEIGIKNAEFPQPIWGFNDDYNKPTFTPSINVVSGDENGKTICHSFVTDGKIQYLDDCTHSMAGMTVELTKGGCENEA